MCASGAFPLMPPVAETSKWLDRFDDLSPKGIAKHVAKLTKFRNEFRAMEITAASPEEHAQASALALSASGAITELHTIRAWEKDPGFYLQIAFIGLGQAASLPAQSEKIRQKRFLKRLKGIPGLLRLAPNNIEAISHSSRATAQTMIRDCARYLTELGKSELGSVGKAPSYLAEALTALRGFDKFVTSHPEIPESGGPSFLIMVENVLGIAKTPEEIYAIAEEEFDHRLKSLNWLCSEIDKESDWKSIHDRYEGPSCNEMEARDVIVREIHRLRSFMLDSALPGVFSDRGLSIESQPLYLASTLRPIQYEPTVATAGDEPSRCRVSSQIFSGRGFRDDPVKLARIRREFIFMTASQTYPGRHLLDSQRHALSDSPLSQITNPLFMAGWVAFAENLLEELGYLENPLDRMVLHQRGLCRAALAMIDAGLAMGNLDQDKSLAILSNAGFSREESLDHVRTIRLAPASRVMPVLGLHEITMLRKKANMELGPFCKKLFSGGQLPFSIIAQQMRNN